MCNYKQSSGITPKRVYKCLPGAYRSVWECFIRIGVSVGFYDIPALLPPYKSTGDWARLIRHCAAYLSGLRPVSLIRRQQKTPETVSLRSLL